jgi:dipeptidyl aminopeptidase/acylaminoacyl peptidase
VANYKWDELWGNEGGDVWIQANSSDIPVPITRGGEDHSGWWAPLWSPDGRRIAMLSTRGGNVRLWAWDAKTREIRLIADRGVDSFDPRERMFAWIDNDHVLFVGTPDHDQPMAMQSELQAPTIAAREWPKAQEGVETSSSVIESGIEEKSLTHQTGDIVVADVNGGGARTVAHVNPRTWFLSPDARTVAYTHELGTRMPDAGGALPTAQSSVIALEVVRVDGTAIHFKGASTRDAVIDSVRWSPDGRVIAFLGYEPGHNQSPLLYRVDTVSGVASARTLPGLQVATLPGEPIEMEWTSENDLIVLAAGAHVGSGTGVRRDWWLVGESGPPHILTATIPEPPSRLWPEVGSKAFFGVAGGNLWSILPRERKVVNLAAALNAPVEAINWPSRDTMNNGTGQYRVPNARYSDAIFTVHDGERRETYRIDLNDGRTTHLTKPDAAATVRAYDPHTSSAVWVCSDRNGLRIWRNDVRQDQTRLSVQANDFLREIAEGDFKKIHYRSLNGTELEGWLLLPVGYKVGMRYPLLTWVYPGTVQGDLPPANLATIDSSSYLNMQIPAAMGFAVLFPSMPLARNGVVDDPMLRLTEGVIPAVDKAVELGIADPARVYVFGQSFGGYGVYGLVTQTSRFRAAIALAGVSDLISLYGTLDVRARYAEHPRYGMSAQTLMETGPIHMGGPPWTDLGRYIRNSPVFAVDRVTTPILIVQGDMDYVAIQQGEEFFASLYRQRKRAQFVRYWGEGHTIESPANIRDLWQRIFTWLEQNGSSLN